MISRDAKTVPLNTRTAVATPEALKMICQFAKERDYKALYTYLQCNSDYVTTIDHKFILKMKDSSGLIASIPITAAGFLAAEGDTTSARYLKTLFNADRSQITFGAILGGKQSAPVHEEKAHAGMPMIDHTTRQSLFELFERANGLLGRIPSEIINLENLVYAYAMGGYQNLALEHLAKNPELATTIICGAAEGGHFQWVKKLIQTYPGLYGALIQGAIYGDHVHYIEELYQKAENKAEMITFIRKHIKRISASDRTSYGGTMLTFMASVQDPEFRLALVGNGDDDLTTYLSMKVNKIHRIMHDKKISFSEARNVFDFDLECVDQAAVKEELDSIKARVEDNVAIEMPDELVEMMLDYRGSDELPPALDEEVLITSRQKKVAEFNHEKLKFFWRDNKLLGREYTLNYIDYLGVRDIDSVLASLKSFDQYLRDPSDENLIKVQKASNVEKLNSKRLFNRIMMVVLFTLSIMITVAASIIVAAISPWFLIPVIAVGIAAIGYCYKKSMQNHRLPVSASIMMNKIAAEVSTYRSSLEACKEKHSQFVTQEKQHVPADTATIQQSLPSSSPAASRVDNNEGMDNLIKPLFSSSQGIELAPKSDDHPEPHKSVDRVTSRKGSRE